MLRSAPVHQPGPAPGRTALLFPPLLLRVLQFGCRSDEGHRDRHGSGLRRGARVSGFRPPPAAEDATAAEDESQISPTALIGFAAIIVGGGLGLGLPRPRARWISGAVASGIAVVAVVVNQVMIHRRAKEALDQAASTFRDQLEPTRSSASRSPCPRSSSSDEPGFWVVTVLLGLVVAYNVYRGRRPAARAEPAVKVGCRPGRCPAAPPLPLDRRQGVQEACPSDGFASLRAVAQCPSHIPAAAGSRRRHGDPHGQPCNRWWDGFQWTHNTSPLGKG